MNLCLELRVLSLKLIIMDMPMLQVLSLKYFQPQVLQIRNALPVSVSLYVYSLNILCSLLSFSPSLPPFLPFLFPSALHFLLLLAPNQLPLIESMSTFLFSSLNFHDGNTDMHPWKRLTLVYLPPIQTTSDLRTHGWAISSTLHYRWSLSYTFAQF